MSMICVDTELHDRPFQKFFAINVYLSLFGPINDAQHIQVARYPQGPQSHLAHSSCYLQ